MGFIFGKHVSFQTGLYCCFSCEFWQEKPREYFSAPRLPETYVWNQLVKREKARIVPALVTCGFWSDSGLPPFQIKLESNLPMLCRDDYNLQCTCLPLELQQADATTYYCNCIFCLHVFAYFSFHFLVGRSSLQGSVNFEPPRNLSQNSFTPQTIHEWLKRLIYICVCSYTIWKFMVKLSGWFSIHALISGVLPARKGTSERPIVYVMPCVRKDGAYGGFEVRKVGCLMMLLLFCYSPVTLDSIYI